MNKDFIDKLAPFGWVEHKELDENGKERSGKITSVSFILSDGYKDEVFQTRADDGFECGGYGWAALADVFLSERMPELKEDIEFDPEAGMFCVYSSNIEALKKFALGMREMFDDNELMIDLLSRATDEWL